MICAVLSLVDGLAIDTYVEARRQQKATIAIALALCSVFVLVFRGYILKRFLSRRVYQGGKPFRESTLFNILPGA